MIDSRRFPTLAAYLARLPAGIDSYPECQSKATVVRSALEGHDLSAVVDGLPEPIQVLMRDPPPPSTWIPMVHSDAVFHAICDRLYGTEEEALAWCYERTMRMIETPMYRKLVSVAGPGLFFRIADRVFFLFERGTEASVTVRDKSAELVMRHPPHLHSRLNHLGNTALLEAVMEMTGGDNPRADMTESTPTHAIFDCRWE